MGRRTGIILAYDKSVFGESERAFLAKAGPHIDMIKIGLEAMTAENPETGRTVASHIREFVHEVLEKEVMWDIKLADIENTSDRTAQNLVIMGVKFFTLHASMSDGALRKVAQVCRSTATFPLAVTVLTDINAEQCYRIFQRDPGHAVLDLVTKATEAGIRGIVCSPKEVAAIRSEFGDELTLVVPGIRPVGSQQGDQKRTMTPAEAARAGADYVVIGRPIMEAADPLAAAIAIRKELDEAFASI